MSPEAVILYDLASAVQILAHEKYRVSHRHRAAKRLICRAVADLRDIPAVHLAGEKTGGLELPLLIDDSLKRRGVLVA